MLKSKFRRTDTQLSDPDINEGVVAKEAELIRLQRQYRLMEGDRKTYCDSSKSFLAKQRESISKLQKENSMLHFELTLVERRLDYQEKNGIRHKKAKETINKGEMNVKKYKALLERMQEVDLKIKNMRNEIDKKKDECSKASSIKQTTEYKQRVISELENKLNKALIKFNQTLAINRKTRSLIDDLRGERACFDNLSRKYEKAINEQKRRMTEVIEASTTAYEMRLEAQNRISVLKEKTEKECQAFTQEMNEINRQLEHDQKLRQFMNTKSQEKSIKTNNRKKKQGQFNEEESIFEMYNNSLNNYENIFNTIRKVTGIEDINEFVRTFNDIEDKNFSLFNYVSEISNEIEYSENEIQTLKEKIELLKKEEDENQEEKQKIIKQMEECLESNKDKNEVYVKDTREKQSVIDIICENVTGIVKLLVDYKPPPGAEFYLTPSTFVTNAQAIIEKQNKLKETGHDEASEDKQELEDKDKTNADGTIPEEEEEEGVNKDSETATLEAENKGEDAKKESDNISTNNETEEVKQEEESQEKEMETQEKVISSETRIGEDDSSNLTKPSVNNLTEEEIKNNKKLTEDVINLILNKPETNKIIDKEAGQNATIINLLEDEKVNSINLLEVLRYVEEKVNELLVFNYMTHLPKRKDTSDGDIKPTEKMFLSTEVVDDHNVTLLGPGPEAPITNLNIKIPESEDLPDFLNSGEEEKRLFTREELTKKTIMNFNNKTKEEDNNNNDNIPIN